MANDHQGSNKTTLLYEDNDFDLVAKQRAEQVGKQAGEALASLFTEILLAILADKSVPPTNKVEFPAHLSNNAKNRVDPNIILTAGEVAQILKISKSEAYRLIQQGEIQGNKFGRTTRVRGQDLESFIADHMK